MRKIRSENTAPELKLRKLIWGLGIRYRINDSSLQGKPDIVIKKHKLAIFVDGEFWHGYNWEEKKQRIKSNREYWIPKIEKNMVRDSDNTQSLEYQGYTVLRFWEHEIKKNTGACLNKILNVINKNEGYI